MNTRGESNISLPHFTDEEDQEAASFRVGRGRQEQAQVTTRTHSDAYVWYVVVLLAVVNVFNSADRIALAVLSPLIKADLALSDTQLGLLIGLAFSVFYAIAGIPIARQADRGIRRNIIALALAAWSVMTALCGAAQNFSHLFAARVGVGVGEAGCLAPGHSMICDFVPLRRRSGVFAIQSVGLYAGMVLGMVLVSWLGEVIGWRWAFVLIGLPGIALAIVVKLSLREPVRGFFDAVKDNTPAPSLRATFCVLWGCKTYRLLVFSLVLNGFVVAGLTQWWPSFYARVFGLNLSTVGAYLGLAIGVGSGLGALIGGFVSNKLASRDVRIPLFVGAGAIALAFPAAIGSLLVSSASISMLLLSLTVMFWSVPIGPVTMAKVSVVASKMRATATALAIFFISGLGFGLGPVCVGFLSDVLSRSSDEHALRYALMPPTVLLLVMVITLRAAARTLPGDLRAISILGSECNGRAETQR